MVVSGPRCAWFAALAWGLTLVFAGLHAQAGMARQRIHVRWAASATADDRQRLEHAFGLAGAEHREGRTWSYLPIDRSPANIARLLDNPLVEDTQNIDRSARVVVLERPDLPRWIVRLAQAQALLPLATLSALAAAALTWGARAQLSARIERCVVWLRTQDGGSLRWLLQRATVWSIWLFFLHIAYGYFEQVRGGGDNWSTADWLINYAGGPVRRGLVGTLLFMFASAGLPLKWVVFGTQVVTYGAVVALVVRMYNLRRRASPWLLLFASPAFLLFPFFNVEAAFRKEILVFLPLAILCASYARQRVWWGELAIVAAVFLVAAFSHEMTAFTLPFFLYLVYRLWIVSLLPTRIAAAMAGFFCAAAAGGILFSLSFPADSSLIASLCDSLVSRGFRKNICEGAIVYLDRDTSFWFGEKHVDIRSYLAFYMTALAVALAPMAAVKWRGRDRITLAVSGLVVVSVLAFVAIDWGRWIHLYVFCLFCIVLAESAVEDIGVTRVPAVVTALYVTTWSVPFCCAYAFRGGMLQAALDWMR